MTMQMEVASLGECEAIIERGLASFVEVGEALLRIRDERLYRESHGTFEEYCRERWGLSRKRAYDLTAAAEVVALTSPIGDSPRSESVARELAPLRDQPIELRDTWTEAVATHGATPTAAQVREVVKARTAPSTIYEEDEGGTRRCGRMNHGW